MHAPLFTYTVLGGDADAQVALNRVTSLSLHPLFVVVGTERGEIMLYDKAGRGLLRVSAHEKAVSGMAVDAETDTFASVSLDGSMILHYLRCSPTAYNGEPVSAGSTHRVFRKDIDKPLTCVSFAGSPFSFLAGGHAGQLFLVRPGRVFGSRVSNLTPPSSNSGPVRAVCHHNVLETRFDPLPVKNKALSFVLAKATPPAASVVAWATKDVLFVAPTALLLALSNKDEADVVDTLSGATRLPGLFRARWTTFAIRAPTEGKNPSVSLAWAPHDVLLAGMGNAVMVLRPSTIASPLLRPGGEDDVSVAAPLIPVYAPHRIVRITQSVLCGILPFGVHSGHPATLLCFPSESQSGSSDGSSPQVFLTQVDKDVFLGDLSSRDDSSVDVDIAIADLTCRDTLAMHTGDDPFPEDFSLVHTEHTREFYAVAPHDIVLGTPTTSEATIAWLMDNHQYKEALTVFSRLSPSERLSCGHTENTIRISQVLHAVGDHGDMTIAVPFVGSAFRSDVELWKRAFRKLYHRVDGEGAETIRKFVDMLKDDTKELAAQALTSLLYSRRALHEMKDLDDHLVVAMTCLGLDPSTPHGPGASIRGIFDDDDDGEDGTEFASKMGIGLMDDEDGKVKSPASTPAKEIPSTNLFSDEHDGKGEKETSKMEGQKSVHIETKSPRKGEVKAKGLFDDDSSDDVDGVFEKIG
eukprot:TRINITY_DN2902_c0_g1_i1.p1 TRINITY_DN2902_c0_g1~~TRINITY_DN2902_c0_g1_i1.p1  ORF type:complete len:693 (+),score=186.01 TRINITY_DN2902_c0_g1_i1:51-2129(+)